MELNREQIIKALKCCAYDDACSSCPLQENYTNCVTIMKRDALSLIRELTEENEKLRAERDTFEINYKDLKYRNQELLKDAVAWEKECREWEYEDALMRERLSEIKADTVRRMQERLKECFPDTEDHKAVYLVQQIMFAIDQIAKELLEETK